MLTRLVPRIYCSRRQNRRKDAAHVSQVLELTKASRWDCRGFARLLAASIAPALLAITATSAWSTTLTLHGTDFAEAMTAGVDSVVNVSQDISVSLPHVLNGTNNPDPRAATIFVWVGFPHGDSTGRITRSVLKADGMEFSSISNPIHDVAPWGGALLQHFFLALNDTAVSTSGIPWDGSPIAVGVAPDVFANGGALRVTMNGNIDGGSAAIDGAVIRVFHSTNGNETDVGEIYGGPSDFPYQKALDIYVSGRGSYELTVPFSLSTTPPPPVGVPEPSSAFLCVAGFLALARHGISRGRTM
jgi:hypothetical protein